MYIDKKAIRYHGHANKITPLVVGHSYTKFMVCAYRAYTDRILLPIGNSFSKMIELISTIVRNLLNKISEDVK